jgi:hypothetical protein
MKIYYPLLPVDCIEIIRRDKQRLLTMVKAALPPVQGMPVLRRSTRSRFPILKRVAVVAALFMTAHTVNTWLFHDIIDNDTNEENPVLDWAKLEERPASHIIEGTCEWLYMFEGAIVLYLLSLGCSLSKSFARCMLVL